MITRSLSLLSSEIGSRYSFRGLMKKLDLHQQSLARSLHRLEYLGLIERIPFGYKMSNNGQSIMMSKREFIVSDKIKKEIYTCNFFRRVFRSIYRLVT